MEFYNLNSEEKRKEPILVSLLAISAIAIIKGIHNDKNGIDEDYILWPLFSISFGSFFLIYALNALTKGNLVRKWIIPFVFNYLFSFLQKRKKLNHEEAMNKTTRLLGKASLTIAILLFISTIVFFIHPFHL